ncbi:MAG: exo-beta-N-acetylmuramidase NamZ domain-containing protein, partial [Mucilaginibacter sp.]
MNINRFALLFAAIILITTVKVNAQTNTGTVERRQNTKKIIPGADQTNLYIDYLKGKNIGMVINQTSVIGTHLTPSVDTLLKLGVTIKKIFGPEHGFRGNASDGATINDSVD